MTKPLSMDLRERALASIAGGGSGGQAAERFGVSAASVGRRRAREREQGDALPRAQGEDRKSHRIDAHQAMTWRCSSRHPISSIEELRHSLSKNGCRSAIVRCAAFFERNKIKRNKDRRLRGFCRKVLIPELPTAAIVIMANLSSHKGLRMHETIQAAGAMLLYPPPFSPTSIRSRTPSRSSKQICEGPPNALSTVSGGAIARSTYAPAESTDYFATDRLSLDRKFQFEPEDG